MVLEGVFQPYGRGDWGAGGVQGGNPRKIHRRARGCRA